MKTGDTVWFIDSYNNLVTGTLNLSPEYGIFVEVKTGYGSRLTSLDDCYSTREECLEAYRRSVDAIKKEHAEGIQSVNDLVRFMFHHCVFPAEEYTDWEAREVAILKAEEFGIELGECN